MSFVGTRPEVVKYVKKYKPEYLATLLLPAGITSEASIRYKDEAELSFFLRKFRRVNVWNVIHNLYDWCRKPKSTSGPTQENCRDYYGVAEPPVRW